MAIGNTRNLRISVNNPPVEITIETKSSIIYLVGKNGAGKSRFLDGLKKGNGWIKQVLSNKTTNDIFYRYLDWGTVNFDLERSLNENFASENKTLEATNQSIIDFQEKRIKGDIIIEDGQKTRQDKVILKASRNKLEFTSLDEFSTGTLKMHNFLQWKLKDSLGLPFLPKKNSKAKHGQRLFVVALEEPENNLHPNLQKQLPQHLQSWVDEKTSLSGQILIIVTTHSPFILKGASKHK